MNERYTPLNSELTIGIMGLGYIGNFVALNIKKLGYNVIGFKRNVVKKNTSFEIYKSSSLSKFTKKSDVIVSILPDTKKTKNFINANFLKKMKESSLLVNIGRGSAVNELDLIKHIKNNQYEQLLNEVREIPDIDDEPVMNCLGIDIYEKNNQTQQIN